MSKPEVENFSLLNRIFVSLWEYYLIILYHVAAGTQHSHRLGFASGFLSPLLVSMVPQAVFLPWILISFFAVGGSVATELMVSCKGAHPHPVMLATPMNFFLQMQVLNVVNRGLIESVCNYSQCFPTALLLVGKFCLIGVVPGMCLSGLWHNFHTPS